MNPMQMMKLAGMWKQFQSEHPKFPLFLQAVTRPGVITEGAVIEISVTTKEGQNMTTNLKLTAQDLALFESLKDMK